jgi:hypothetical protein
MEAGRRKRLVGYRSTELAAAYLADRFALQLHGEFASLNFPQDATSPVV